MRIFLLLAILVLAAGCAATNDESAEQAAGGERASEFAVRVDTYLRKGQFGPAWRELHPEQRKLVSRSQLASCWESTDDVLDDPTVEIQVTGQKDEQWRIPGTNLTRPSTALAVQAVTVRETRGQQVRAVVETWTQHTFDAGEEGWAWILAPALLHGARSGFC